MQNINKVAKAGKLARQKPKSAGFTLERYGYVTADGEPVAPEYLVRITSYRNKCTVVGVLQEDITMRVESRWEYVVPTAILDLANLAIQAVSSGRWSVITKATSRRIWQGSSPLQISLNLKFEAVEDPYREVVQPCKFLQAMTLPANIKFEQSWAKARPGIVETAKHEVRETLKGVAGTFLSPPGPTPFTTKGLFTRDSTRSIDEIVNDLKGGDIIKVDIGRFLSFWNVVVKNVTPVFHSKFVRKGDPISAQVNIVFESYEMMTVETLEEAYSKSNFSNKTIRKDMAERVIKGKVKQVSNG